MRVLLISTYELGRQPFGLASPAAWLRQAGIEVICADLARSSLDEGQVRAADLIAFYLPMHMATRLAVPVIERVHRLRPDAKLCAYGLYAPPNAALLEALGVEVVLGGEFEAELLAVVTGTRSAPESGNRQTIPRLQFRVPDRSSLPPLPDYASLRLPDGQRRVVGYTEASRGCKHLCRHCPVVPIYGGQFRIVQRDVVLADIRAQVAAGARHITFGDPDFFNGVRHAIDLVTEMAREFPDVSYDVTIKIQHLLEHRDRLSALRDTGCLFVTSAVESLDDEVLRMLEKQHTRRDFHEAVALCREAGLTLAPTFVAFHPWLTVDGYLDLLDTLRALDLVTHVAPIQLAIRLLIPEGSRLLELEDIRRLVGPFDPLTLSYPWAHPDPALDDLQREVMRLVSQRMDAPRTELFGLIEGHVHARAGRLVAPRPGRASAALLVPCLSEPWYCCAEPLPEQDCLI